jgi:hypothetical protein
MKEKVDVEIQMDATSVVDLGRLRHPSLATIIPHTDLVAPSFVPSSVHGDL